MGFLQQRLRTNEWIDRPDIDPRQLRKSLAYIRKINHYLRYTDVTLAQLESLAGNWKPGEVIRILDIATGSADIPRAILEWADRRKLNVRITGIDLHAQILKIAEEDGPDPRLTLLRGNAMQLPFADGCFDYAHTAMFLHHLDDDDVVRVLREMGRVSSRGVIVSDLLRRKRAYGWIKAFTFFSTPMVRHDGPASVAQAFTPEEVHALRDGAGLGYLRYAEHFAHRFTLTGEKPPAPASDTTPS